MSVLLKSGPSASPTQTQFAATSVPIKPVISKPISTATIPVVAAPLKPTPSNPTLGLPQPGLPTHPDQPADVNNVIVGGVFTTTLPTTSTAAGQGTSAVSPLGIPRPAPLIATPNASTSEVVGKTPVSASHFWLWILVGIVIVILATEL